MFLRSTLSNARRASCFSRALHVEASKTSITDAVAKEKIVVFSKTYCPYCARVKKLLDVLDTKYETVELDTRDDGDEMQTLLFKITGQYTVPNVFINGKHIGGCDDVMIYLNKQQTRDNAGQLRDVKTL
ncbi:unnamed protein product [Peronospora belbahrii]|uniref:Glutaredoxin domain-containing protein n=1 Tax=Peronospora belbahrii TaxID=622444 RepID=A0AAU9KP29_9STRA|nr:unnamed protein product [Peronospora belbahrii]CAH0515500.1 unnamed protein product [Peronospora belbahrii]